MSESPPENPYASPAAVDDNLEPRLSGEAGELRPIRPRWWEIGLFAVLMSGVLLIAGFTIYVAFVVDVAFSAVVGLFISAALVSMVTMFVGGVVALRAWIENGFHLTPPPGHSMMMGVLLGSIIGVAGMIVETSTHSLGPPFNLLGRVLLELITFVICFTTFALLWRHAGWNWVGAIFLTVAILEFCLPLFTADTDFWMPRKTISGLPVMLVSILWLFAAAVTGIVAFREYQQGRSRDWLHWTGVICWILPLVLFSLHKLVEELS